MSEENPISVQIITPERTWFEGMVNVIRFPGKQAPFTVLRDHGAMISVLTEGVITLNTGTTRDRSFHILSGFVEINNNNVVVCVTPK